jgi:2-methylcitrate dehydratase PrpD
MNRFPPLASHQDPAGKMAEMVVGTPYSDIPTDVVELAKRAIFDTIAVTIAGSGWAVSPQIVQQVQKWGGAPESRILVYGHRVPAPLAAFANGAMARAIDMGDVHETGGHVSEWNVPAMLAALGICDRPITGEEFLAAYVTGSEFSVRVNTAIDGASHSAFGIPGEFHGPLGATASVSRLLGLSLEETWNALGITFSVHGLSEMQKYAEGTQMTRVQHAFAGETSIKAAVLARQGVTGPRGIFLGEPGGALRHIGWSTVNPDVLTDDLGKRWLYAEGLSMKPYSACKFTHSFIAGVIDIVNTNHLNHEDISRILCIGSEGARMTAEPAEAKWNPRSPAEALYSTPYCVAIAAITGDAFLDDFTLDTINRADTRELMRKVVVQFDPEIQDQFEGFTVEISLQDGRAFRQTTPYVLGHTKNQMSWDDLNRKFWKCAAHSAVSLPDTQLGRIGELCAHLDKRDDVSQLLDALTP